MGVVGFRRGVGGSFRCVASFAPSSQTRYMRTLYCSTWLLLSAGRLLYLAAFYVAASLSWLLHLAASYVVTSLSWLLLLGSWYTGGT